MTTPSMGSKCTLMERTGSGARPSSATSVMLQPEIPSAGSPVPA